MSETIEDVRGDHDEDGFHLHVVTDEEGYNFRVVDVEMARKLIREVSRLRTWIEDHDRERAAYDRATPEERQAVLNRGQVEDDVAERLRERADLDCKRERENRG